MWNMIWPLALIVASNCFYNICTKSMPSNANAFASLTATYLAGSVLSAALFLCGTRGNGIGAELSKINWTSIVLSFAIVGLEAGYVFLYRAGWKVSIGSLTANICLAIALLAIGCLRYRETITPRQLLGILVCGAGLFLICK